MAQNFRNDLQRNVGTSEVTLITGGDFDAVIGIRCCNVTTSTIEVDVFIDNSGIGTGNTTYYCIFEQGTNTFEIGLGTLSGSTTLERTTVINNSSGNTSKISFTGGTLDVFVTMPAAKTVYLDASGTPVGAASNGFALAMAVAL